MDQKKKKFCTACIQKQLLYLTTISPHGECSYLLGNYSVPVDGGGLGNSIEVGGVGDSRDPGSRRLLHLPLCSAGNIRRQTGVKLCFCVCVDLSIQRHIITQTYIQTYIMYKKSLNYEHT